MKKILFESRDERLDTLRKILTSCGELGIKYLTVYAFSTENW